MSFALIESRFERLRTNKIFEIFVIAVIIFSALVIGVKTYDIPPLVTEIVGVLDWVITVIFLVEISIRFIGDPDKKHFFNKGWNIFDTVIVLVSLVPVEDSEMAVIGRLIRIFRVLRMVSIIPELRVLLNSLLKALPQLGYIMLLMFIIFYIYAAVGSTFFAHINPVLWGDISISMLTLFRVMTFEDWTDVMYETQEYYPFSWIFYLSFIFFTAFAFLNMIIGIVVGVMEKENRANVEENQEESMEQFEQLHQEIRELRRIIEQKL
jgi:voltage-gated sodium channel